MCWSTAKQHVNSSSPLCRQMSQFSHPALWWLTRGFLQHYTHKCMHDVVYWHSNIVTDLETCQKFITALNICTPFTRLRAVVSVNNPIHIYSMYTEKDAHHTCSVYRPQFPLNFSLFQPLSHTHTNTHSLFLSTHTHTYTHTTHTQALPVAQAAG